ncbi:MAG: 50S ribosomal protein L28 [Ignavibacteria bacterium]|jgi:large subunit ribosomal protein L28|nr:50S ribosomal protein L28 [Ignavibacteria bacterium]
MSRVCKVTGKKHLTGNNVSHANNRTKRRQLPNLQYKRIWDEEKKIWVRMRLSTEAIKTIEKKGLKAIKKG